jgi:hypothetical protein
VAELGGGGLVVAAHYVSVEEARAKLGAYLRRGTVRRYDLGEDYEPSSADALSIDDVRRTWWVRSRIARRDREAWVELGRTAPWHLVPRTRRLHDDEAQLDRALALFIHFLGPQRGIARVSKVLHLKRSAFFPIVDSRIGALYFPRVGARLSRATLPAYWAAIRDDLLKPSNVEALATLRIWIGDRSDSEERYAQLRPLSDLRLLDIASW